MQQRHPRTGEKGNEHMIDDVTQMSKFLACVLRHKPDRLGIVLDQAGWVEVSELICCAGLRGRVITRESLAEVIKQSEKPRFSLSEDGQRIRASYGHSVPVKLDLPIFDPPNLLYYGTGEGVLMSLLGTGIRSPERKFVQLFEDMGTAVKAGMRGGRPVVLEVSARTMAVDGHLFHRLGTGLWLTIPACYIKVAALKGTEGIFEVVRCVRCNFRGQADAFAETRSVYHDMRCPRCATTQLDTSVLNRAWALQGRRYGYGDDNCLLQ